MLCPSTFLQGFKEITETDFKLQKGHTCITWPTIDNVLKAGKSELRILCLANCIMVIYVCIKFQENILNSFQVTEWTQIFYRNHYFQCLRVITPKEVNQSYGFCALHVLLECFTFVRSFIKISGMGFNLQSGHEQMEEMAMFNVQRAITPKVGKPELRFMYSACRLIVLYIYIYVNFRENISDGIRVIEQTRMIEALTDGRTDRRTDGRTLKNLDGIT